MSVRTLSIAVALHIAVFNSALVNEPEGLNLSAFFGIEALFEIIYLFLYTSTLSAGVTRLP